MDFVINTPEPVEEHCVPCQTLFSAGAYTVNDNALRSKIERGLTTRDYLTQP